MTAYFDPDAAATLAFLPPEAQTATNLDLHATDAEADVIRFFTRDIGVGSPYYDADTTTYTLVGDRLGVFLRHYKEDVDNLDTGDADTVAFLNAMRRTIAAVIVWRLVQDTMNRAALGESTSSKGTIQKAMYHAEPFPPYWERWLRPFSTLPALVVTG